MKKWSIIFALILCCIAMGGLAVVFRSEKEPSSSDNPNNSNGGSSYNDEIDGIDLNETNLIF